MERIRHYHEHSKHFPQRLAPGPEHLDWEHQPDPFRTYAGAPRVRLPLVADQLTLLFADLYRPTSFIPKEAMDLRGLAALWELSLGLSAWKVYGSSRWALRCNPSSGNLHPTEAYLVVPTLAATKVGSSLAAGVYHYVSRDHSLEQRCRIQDRDLSTWNGLFPPCTVVLGLASIHRRTTWKYGDRAYRYCQLDLGHAIAALRYAAAALGWRVEILASPATQDIAKLLGLSADLQEDDGPEQEFPNLLLQVTLPGASSPDMGLVIERLADLVARGPWLGVANRLSAGHALSWPQVDVIANAVSQPQLPAGKTMHQGMPERLSGMPVIKAAEVIRRRRSAQRFDDQAWLDQEVLWRILDATAPRVGAAPWDLLPWPPRIHPVLMLHRVRGLAPGLYLLLRRTEARSSLQEAMYGHFSWTSVPGLPGDGALFLLQEGDLRELAKVLSCQQEIAGDSVLSLGMLAEFDAGLASGPWGYPRLFWEAGILGQTLYLEAEAVGMRGTGIGCFFDDLVHQLLGLRNTQLQSLYHFTLGLPILDHRLQTEPPYEVY
ncbi:MAG: SagB/ThcOx family dehydrogenase [Magnetococcus sp. YQC-5]